MCIRDSSPRWRRWAIAMPTAEARPEPSGPVVISTPKVWWTSGCPGVREPHVRSDFRSSSSRPYPERYSWTYCVRLEWPHESGHSSLTQYVQLYLSGYGLELDDLKSLRTWGSLTPGHPEVHHTKGVEITTGPLGSGLASAVGMAMAQRRQRGLLDPDAAPGESPFDHRVYVIASDGDIMEGVSHEASALAGHQELGNLTVVYDQNHISIEDDTNISFSEDVGKRYEAYGWHVVTVDWRSSWSGGSHRYVEDIDALLAAIESGHAISDKPTLVILKTVIAWPAPTKRNTGASHGSALGDQEIAATKTLLGFDPAQTFEVDDAVLDRAREVIARGRSAHAEWSKGYAAWRASH